MYQKTLDALLIERRIENGEITAYEIEKRELVNILILMYEKRLIEKEKALMKLDNLKRWVDIKRK